MIEQQELEVKGEGTIERGMNRQVGWCYLTSKHLINSGFQLVIMTTPLLYRLGVSGHWQSV
jgi:hypothetical protein